MRYENPVWHEYFADPFALRVGQEYFAYGTGGQPLEGDGRVFPMLQSSDLVSWLYRGGALEPLKGATAYWAPEVAEADGRFYLYFSAAFGGGDETHQIRV